MNEIFGRSGTMQSALDVASNVGANLVKPDMKNGFLASIADFVMSLMML